VTVGLPAIYTVDDHPLPWLAPLLNGVEHANFFETRATEYSKAATRGNWNDVWASFDQRRKAKKGEGANDVSDGGDDVFGESGAGGAQAAE
jgi:ribonucleoside-diphosphate reductase beta chain